MMRLPRLRAHRWRDAAYVHVDETEDTGMGMELAKGSQTDSMISWARSLFSFVLFRS